MKKNNYMALLAGCLLSALAAAGNVKDSSLDENVERHLSGDQVFMQWVQDPNLLKNKAGDKLEVRQVSAQEVETIKLKNVVPPIRFESGRADIPASYVEKLRDVLESMKDRNNVRLHFVGHADNQPLSEMLVRTFGDNAGLSRERAGEVAEFFKRALVLPPEAISYEWAGDTQPIATNATPDGRALNRRVEVEVWYDEFKDSVKEQEVLITEEIKRIKVCRIETVCKMRFLEGHARRARVRNLVAPLRYDDETINVTAEFTKQIEQALHNLREKGNVQVRFTGYTDNAPLSGRNERIYGNHLALSKARAHRVALAIQEAIKAPTAAIASDGRGSAMPLASNETGQGRTLNRRVEVEFWHDDPLQELPDEPQLCPSPDDAAIVTKVYDPPWGSIAPLSLENGRAIIPPNYTENLRRAMADIAEKSNVRLRFVGYTKNERLERRTAEVYGDDIGLSAARARRAMETIKGQMNLRESQAEHEGRGYVHSDDVVNAGFIKGEASYVAVQVVYDEPMPSDNLDGVDITRLTRELEPKNPYGLNLMRITVDGEPVDDPGRSLSDIQRCTDVALEKADIQFKFDNLESKPRLSVSASATTIAMREVDATELALAQQRFDEEAKDSQAQMEPEEPVSDEEPVAVDGQETTLEVTIERDFSPDFSPDFWDVIDASVDASQEPEQSGSALQEHSAPNARREEPRFLGAPVTFQMYINYSRFIDRAEVRIFDASQSLEAMPLDLVKVDASGHAEWLPTAQHVSAPTRELVFVLRAYDKSGNFDETKPQPLFLVYKDLNESEQSIEVDTAQRTNILANFGESKLAMKNIPLGSGTVKINGSGIPPNHTVWVAGRPAPVDASGNFVAEEILPTGAHTVEVAVLDEAGNGTVFLRDLEFKRDDWFYVGIADLTWSESRAKGPIELLQGEDSQYDFDSSLDGRLAFFVKGKFRERWKLTASADTREGPLGDLFSNFMNKSPDSLFRRIDPDYHYPTFGDDSVVEEMAPTSGKFYVKVSRDENHGMWGNFKIGYMANELAQVDRGLYGGNIRYGSESTTSFGERRYLIDGFAAEPGTVPSREEFRGTGGSLYYLRRQDLLMGSERIRIELRDKDSQIVTGVVNLRPGLDYDIDYLQGRVLLSEPLSSTVDDNLLVRSGGLSGDQAYLVVRYEYTPGFEDIDAVATGGQGHVWITDYLKVGLTTNVNDDGDTDSSVHAADVTVRMSSNSWFKVQAAESDGLVSSSLRSDDGGFGFYGNDTSTFVDANAGAYRADLSVGFADFFKNVKGQLSFYAQSLEAGYSAPGLSTLTDTDNYGGKLFMPVTEKLKVTAKADSRVQEAGLTTKSQEINIDYQLTDRWSVSTGVRNDLREDNSPVVPLTQDEGERRDAVVQVAYDSKSNWRTYAFVQDTLSTTENREENSRIGAGGSYRFKNRLSVDTEVSGGDLGPGGRLGTNYLYSDRTNLYLNYSLENERTDNGLNARKGNLISGVKRRLSDSSSVYLEERYQDSDFVTGLTHATGINLVPNERWNFGATADVGTLKDAQTGAETQRRAGGVRVGYGFESIQISSAVEYRMDETEQADTTISERTTWLFRNNFKYQLTPDWRLLGKFNHSMSESTLGEFYDGGYTEAVIGYGYRPVRHDRLNMLAKYTYFYNVPTTEQVTLQNTAAEFIQKSHIAAVDVTYAVSEQWSIGGKYAYRLGQMALDRENPEFFENRAQLTVVRVDWRFRQNWEGLAEARMLEMPDLKETRSGALVGLYRYLGKHVKVGAGYNFTDFSDDLTDLSFDHQGAFINVVGAL